MAKKDVHPQRFVWVKDKAGNEYVCRIDDLKDPKKVDKDDLKNCIDDAQGRSTSATSDSAGWESGQ